MLLCISRSVIEISSLATMIVLCNQSSGLNEGHVLRYVILFPHHFQDIDYILLAGTHKMVSLTFSSLHSLRRLMILLCPKVSDVGFDHLVEDVSLYWERQAVFSGPTVPSEPFGKKHLGIAGLWDVASGHAKPLSRDEKQTHFQHAFLVKLSGILFDK